MNASTPDPTGDARQRQIPPRGAINLDHIAHFVPDIEAARAALERLGFVPTPFSEQRNRPHPGAPLESAGTGNRCVMLRRGYLEFLTAFGATPTAERMRATMSRHVGVHLVCFGTADPAAVAERLTAQGFAPAAPITLERNVATTGSDGLARFTVIRVPPESMAEGRIQFVHHRTPRLVWQRRWLDHPNRVSALTAAVLCVTDPASAAARYARFTGLADVPAGGVRKIETARGALLFADHTTAARIFGVAPPPPCIAGYGLESDDLGATRTVMARAGAVLRPLDRDAFAAALPSELGGAVIVGGGGQPIAELF
ncbi:MAG TPA: VOC family protein [Alphaproteobacteria bacterium]|nr:VOC family protein [Alphaproteobacteria bacterium]